MAHGARAFSCVRWNEDIDGFEMFCPDCEKAFDATNTFWPLTPEFWDKHNMQRCRACNKRKKAAWIREQRRTNPEFLARELEAAKDNRKAKRAIYNQRYRNRKRTGARGLCLSARPPTPLAASQSSARSDTATPTVTITRVREVGSKSTGPTSAPAATASTNSAPA